MKTLCRSLFIILLFQVTFMSAQNGIPKTIAYQGMLTKQTGATTFAPVAPGNYTIKFSIWDAQNGGNKLWPPLPYNEATINKYVTNGSFDCILGNPIPDPSNAPIDLPFTQQYWLQIFAYGPDAPSEAFKRIQLTTVPYAFRAVALLGSECTATGLRATVGGFSNQGSGDFSIIGGGRGNTISGEADSSVIGGGTMNTIQAERATISGGFANTITESGYSGVIGGGYNNYINGELATVAGGFENHIEDWGMGSTIGGGASNTIAEPNSNNIDYATIAGGNECRIESMGGAIGGGQGNKILAPNSPHAVSNTISGGDGNRTIDAQTSTIGGGLDNAIGWEIQEGMPNSSNTISGGENNRINDAFNSFIGGGGGNIIAYNSEDVDASWACTISGGDGNYAYGNTSTIGGGESDSALGVSSTVPGGSMNKASGDYSFAAGRRAKSLHDGSFVWADQTDADFKSTDVDQFLIRASGGTGIMTPNPQAELHLGQLFTSAPLSSEKAYIAPGPSFTPGVTPTFEGLYMEAYVTDNNRGYRRFSDIASVGYFNGSNGGGVLRFLTNDRNSSTVSERLRIERNGFVGIGTSAPEGALDVASTTGALIVPRMTETNRDALTAVNGMIIYNTTTNRFNFYENGAWVTK